jgi:hypothetical protein
MRAVRVFFGIAVFVVHAMHHRIGTGHQIGRTLGKPGKQVKHPFPLFAGGIHLMAGKTMQKERVKE